MLQAKSGFGLPQTRGHIHFEPSMSALEKVAELMHAAKYSLPAAAFGLICRAVNSHLNLRIAVLGWARAALPEPVADSESIG